MVEHRLRYHFGDYLGKAEVVIYSVLAVLLSVTALVAIASAARLLWEGLSHRTIAVEILRVLAPALGRADTGRDSAHGARLHTLAHFSHRAIPCGWPDCFDSADTGDYAGSLNSHQRRIVVDSGRQHFSSFHA